MATISPETEPLLPLARILAEIAARVTAEESGADEGNAPLPRPDNIREFGKPPIPFKPRDTPPTEPAA
jgi:hypothetical protein